MKVLVCSTGPFYLLGNNVPYGFIIRFDKHTDNELAEQVVNWCIEQFGKSQTSNVLTEIFRKWKWNKSWYTSDNIVMVYVNFRYEEDATLFKLRWL